MKVAIYAILLLVICARRVPCQDLKQCRDSCFSKIPDIKLCNETCSQLPLNASSASNITLPPTPNSPFLLSSIYFNFTLQWTEYSQTYNASPVIFVLEVQRHVNISDPAIILPFIEKYYTTKNTTFTIPQEFVTKANFSFRLAVVTLQGTSNFSPPSPLYTTNSTCDRAEHLETPGKFYPCPVFNVLINFTATEIPFSSPRISSVLSWEYPDDIHINLEYQELYFDVKLEMPETPDSNSNPCMENNRLNDYSDHLIINTSRVSESYTLPDPLYFGCRYDVKIFSYNEPDPRRKFRTEAVFHVPQCIHGFCGCGAGDVNAPKEDSKHIDVHIHRSNHSVNMTSANVTWRNEAWGTKKPAYFRLLLQECPNKRCPPLPRFRGDILQADAMKTAHSFLFQNVTEGELQHVIISAYDRSGCLLTPTEGQLFEAIYIPTRIPSTAKPSTAEPSTAEPSTAESSTELSSTKPTPAVATAGKKGLSSATVAAITVPIVLLLLAGLGLVLLCHYRRRRKPRGLHRDPTGLQRLADHMHHDVRNNYPRNRHIDSLSPYSSDYDRFDLVVNLPSKSEGGLELNPAYVEQRIQEAVETGEADEFEFGYHRLELKRVLGKGAFGKVFLAEAYGMGGSQETSLVAVKVLNEKANEDEVEDFKMEINFMKTIGRHENVLTMLGCCTLYPPLCLVVEYVPHGDLLHYLRNLRKTFEMQNRKLQGEDIEKLKKEEQSTLSETQITGAESVMGPGSYSGRPLIPSASNKKRYEKFFEPGELARLKRTNSASSFSGSSTFSALEAPRRASETPQVHYVARVPTDASNNTETTQVLDTKSAAKTQPSSPSRTMGLDGALDSSDLQSFALQIANGMAYLAGKGVIHRDLAARNILVGDEKVLKISDFGLSREGVYVKRSTGKIPLRWLSIEAMRDRIYSTQSDVWAFGIVLWEICTLGGFPYPTINDRDLLNFLLEGKRMEKPDNCTDEIYQIMLACWERECEDRPSFQTLSEQLFDMQKEEHPYVNVDPSQDFILPPTGGQDTVGNLIAFSDGTFSGATTDHELVESEMPTKQLTSGEISLQGHPPVSSDAENAGYESSREDLSVAGASTEAAKNDAIQFSPRSEPPIDIEDMNDESPV